MEEDCILKYNQFLLPLLPKNPSILHIKQKPFKANAEHCHSLDQEPRGGLEGHGRTFTSWASTRNPIEAAVK